MYVTEKVIEEAIPEKAYIKKQSKRRRRKWRSYLRYHPSIRCYLGFIISY